jgi:hypothetical protein
LLFVVVVYLVVTKRTIFVGFIVLVMALLGYFYYSSLYNQTNFGPLNFLIERGDEDTRTGVEVAMIEDMSTQDWFMGKGINGDYYCPNIDDLDTTGYRDVVETGFLQIMLKGGGISLTLLLMIVLPAIFLGIKGKNILGKGAGIWILMWTLFLYPGIGNSFSLNHVLVWVCVGICYSPNILSMTDDEVFEALQKPKKKSSKKSNQFSPQQA